MRAAILVAMALASHRRCENGCGKFVAKLFVRVLENTQISSLHGSEILG